MSVFNQPFNDPSSSCFDLCSITPRPIGHRLPNYGNGNGILAPEDERKKQENDALIAQALSGLTFEERQQQQEMLHGVEDKILEDELLVEQALHDLDLHLASIKAGSVYEIAESMDFDYVSATPFRLMFLRANKYEPEASADQMLRFFESKNDMFGPDKLVKDITMQDTLMKVTWHPSILVGCNIQGEISRNHMRAQYYTIMKALESEDTQLRGIVSIWNALENFRNKFGGEKYNKMFAAASALPQKKAAIHICFDEVAQYILCNAVIKVMGGRMRARLRVHFGSKIECEYQLITFGIMAPSLPMDARGNMDLSRHLSWIRACARQDNVVIGPSAQILPESSNNTGIQPNLNDVLFSRSKSINHEGNKRLRALVKDYNHAYDAGSAEMKRQIVFLVIGKVHESGGRFLKQCKESWEVVSDESELRKKVMQTFRNRRRIDSELKQSASEGIVGTLIAGDPLPNDVIFGKVTRRNAGTELLHHLIKESFEDYESLDRGVKMVLVETIMKTITDDQGGRFLQDADSGRWMELSHDDAKERISKYFRNYRRKLTRKAK